MENVIFHEYYSLLCVCGTAQDACVLRSALISLWLYVKFRLNGEKKYSLRVSIIISSLLLPSFGKWMVLASFHLVLFCTSVKLFLDSILTTQKAKVCRSKQRYQVWRD